MAENPVGTITHYYGKLQVGIVTLTGDVSTGDTLRFLGHGADFQQTVTSMQVDHSVVEAASAGTQVGIRVAQRVREGTKVYRVSTGGYSVFERLKALFLSK